jgi:hypothetical protein
MALAEIASPEMRVWHSTDGEWLDRSTATTRMAEAQDAAPAPTVFEVIAVHVTERGFVVQARVERAEGRTHVVQVLTVEDELVCACEEYIALEADPTT